MTCGLARYPLRHLSRKLRRNLSRRKSSFSPVTTAVFRRTLSHDRAVHQRRFSSPATPNVHGACFSPTPVDERLAVTPGGDSIVICQSRQGKLFGACTFQSGARPRISSAAIRTATRSPALDKRLAHPRSAGRADHARATTQHSERPRGELAHVQYSRWAAEAAFDMFPAFWRFPASCFAFRLIAARQGNSRDAADVQPAR